MKTSNAKLEMRRRPVLEESSRRAHARVFARLEAMKNEWWSGARPSLVDDGALEIQINLGDGLQQDALGYISYIVRDADYVKDKAMYDDRLIIDFQIEPERYRRLVNDGLMQYIRAFEPYRVQIILDEDVALDDWEEAVAKNGRSGGDADGRDGVIRVWPVSFYDEELCRRAFSLQPSEVVERIAAEGYNAEEMCGGVLIRVSNELLSPERVGTLSDALTALLRSNISTLSR